MPERLPPLPILGLDRDGIVTITRRWPDGTVSWAVVARDGRRLLGSGRILPRLPAGLSGGDRGG